MGTKSVLKLVKNYFKANCLLYRLLLEITATENSMYTSRDSFRLTLRLRIILFSFISNASVNKSAVEIKVKCLNGEVK